MPWRWMLVECGRECGSRCWIDCWWEGPSLPCFFHQNSSSWAPYWILSFGWAKFMVGRSLFNFGCGEWWRVTSHCEGFSGYQKSISPFLQGWGRETESHSVCSQVIGEPCPPQWLPPLSTAFTQEHFLILSSLEAQRALSGNASADASVGIF